MPGIVGRDSERAALERMLDAGSEGIAVAAIDGEAGIGKTAVWREAVRLGAERGYRVLTARPAEAEATLAFASLADLLEPIGDEQLAILPAPQRHALEVALLRTGPSGVTPQARAVAAGVATLLRDLARTRPVLIAIDDVQWLDRQTDAALSFALRRLGTERIALILTQRVQRSVPDPLGLRREHPDRVVRVHLGPLNLAALYHLLRNQLGVTYPRAVLRRIEDVSGGNPLYALELARAHEAVGRRPGPGEPMPIGRLQDLIAARIARLPVATRRALLAVASLTDANDAALRRALGETGLASLRRAERAALIEHAGERIRFVHPLYGAAVIAGASADERRATHRQLADAAVEPEARAWHLALGSADADEEIAAALESAAEHAARRGAPDAGSELMELAVDRTPAWDGATVARRRLALAELAQRSGDTNQALREVSVVIESTSNARLRARALEHRARIEWATGTAAEAANNCERALLETDIDLELRARIHATRSIVELSDADVAERHAQTGLGLIEQVAVPDPVVHAEVVLACIGAEVQQGRRLPEDLVRRGLELERLAPNPNVGDRLSAAIGAIYKYAGDFAAARHWLELTHRAAIEEGDEGSLPYAVSHLPQLELWSGDFEAAERWAHEHRDVAERTGQASQRLQAAYNLAQVLAHMGRIEEAREVAEPALAEALTAGDEWLAWTLSGVLGFAALCLGDNQNALRYLKEAHAFGEKMQDREPRRQMGDYAEALAATGELGEAARMAEELVARSRAAQSALILPNALRARAIVAAAQGRMDDATAAIREALAEHEHVDVPFDRARTLLAAGQIRRRLGERRAAREALEEARGIFRRLGSPPWERRAEDELRRIAIRRPAGDALTETEARVAALVADGRTNREIAEALFVSIKTVEANLTRIYGKLGVRSRVGLAARLAEPAHHE